MLKISPDAVLHHILTVLDIPSLKAALQRAITVRGRAREAAHRRLGRPAFLALCRVDLRPHFQQLRVEDVLALLSLGVGTVVVRDLPVVVDLARGCLFLVAFLDLFLTAGRLASGHVVVSVVDLIHRLHLRKGVRAQLEALIAYMLLTQIDRILIALKRAPEQ